MEGAGIKMSTNEELGADKANTVGAEETAEKNRILLGRLRQASNIGSSGRLWNWKFSSHMNESEQMFVVKIASETPAETIVLGETSL